MKGSPDVTVKLLPCDLEISGLSRENNLLQNMIRLCTIDPSLGLALVGVLYIGLSLFII